MGGRRRRRPAPRPGVWDAPVHHGRGASPGQLPGLCHGAAGSLPQLPGGLRQQSTLLHGGLPSGVRRRPVDRRRLHRGDPHRSPGGRSGGRAAAPRQQQDRGGTVRCPGGRRRTDRRRQFPRPRSPGFADPRIAAAGRCAPAAHPRHRAPHPQGDRHRGRRQQVRFRHRGRQRAGGGAPGDGDPGPPAAGHSLPHRIPGDGAPPVRDRRGSDDGICRLDGARPGGARRGARSGGRPRPACRCPR